jgi:hypothetical protein
MGLGGTLSQVKPADFIVNEITFIVKKITFIVTNSQ